MSLELIPQQIIESKIYLLRGSKVMFDRDLALLYGVETRVLNQAVRRNIERFPSDFMFQISSDEMQNWMSQIVISNRERMGIRKPPMVFTEQGIAMLSGVLNSKRAIVIHVQIIRAFAKLRELLQSNNELCRKVEALEKEYDEQFRIVFDAIRRLLAHEDEPDSEIGFHP